MKFLRCCVVAVIGLLLLLSPAFAQYKTSFVSKPLDTEKPKDWTRFTSRADKFDVLLPAAPALKHESIVIGGQQLRLNYYGTRRGQSDYAVLSLTGLNSANWQLAHMLLLDLYCRTSNRFKANFQQDISLDGYAGRQFSLESGERLGEWRIYQVDKTFLAVAGSSNSRNGHSLKYFFDSFSLSGSVSDNKSNVASANTATGSRVSQPADRWLVILQTFSPHERAKAERKMNLLRARGLDAEVISTDSYAKLKPGLLVLAMGPFSKRAAEQRLDQARSVAPQSYVKAGW